MAQYGYYDPAQMGYGDPNQFQAQYDPSMYAAQAQQWYQPAPPQYRMPMGGGEEEPMYVNAKQYHRILKRREARAKLEARFKIEREKKPFMHESRHKHAQRRARGPGGRFTKKNDERKAGPPQAIVQQQAQQMQLLPQ